MLTFLWPHSPLELKAKFKLFVIFFHPISHSFVTLLLHRKILLLKSWSIHYFNPSWHISLKAKVRFVCSSVTFRVALPVFVFLFSTVMQQFDQKILSCVTAGILSQTLHGVLRADAKQTLPAFIRSSRLYFVLAKFNESNHKYYYLPQLLSETKLLLSREKCTRQEQARGLRERSVVGPVRFKASQTETKASGAPHAHPE